MIYLGISILIAICAFFWFKSSKKNPKDPLDSSWLLEESEKRRKLEEKVSKKSSQEVKSVGEVLKNLVENNDGWEKIFEELNPSKDREIQSLLLKLRGPHMFVPKVALNILESCYDKNPALDFEGLIRAALNEAGIITKFRDE